MGGIIKTSQKREGEKERKKKKIPVTKNTRTITGIFPEMVPNIKWSC